MIKITHANISHSKLRLEIEQSNTSFNDLLIEYHEESYEWVNAQEGGIGVSSSVKLYAETNYACYLFRTRTIQNYTTLSEEDGKQFLDQAKKLLDAAIAEEEEEDHGSYYLNLTPSM